MHSRRPPADILRIQWPDSCCNNITYTLAKLRGHPAGEAAQCVGEGMKMVDQITQFAYQYLMTGSETLDLAEIVSAFSESGINLLGLSQFPGAPGKSQVDVITANAGLLEESARKQGWDLSDKKSVFLIQGQDQPNAIGEILVDLARARVSVTAVQAISAGAGRFGALLWVKPSQVETAAQALHCEEPDVVDESSEESFPASDAPAWTFRSA